MDIETAVIEDGDLLSKWLGDPANEGKVVQTRLRASERVIARVTDGIYRQPASALRELISNAWDADASNVTVLTDAPRFSRIYVRDDGSGMSDEQLARLLHHIGGSAKRREEGMRLGVTQRDDAERTPGGRQLIGKIGIGLFSISQLARRFQLITKCKGADYRLIAEVRLRAYSDDPHDDAVTDSDDSFISGEVFIRRESTDDLNAHGTDIILDDIKPPVRDILRSADRWEGVLERQAALDAGDLETWASLRAEPPAYHSGFIEKLAPGSDAASILSIPAKLPWDANDAADIRMDKLMSAVEGEFSQRERPDLSNTLDTYLEMIWTLALSAPVPYVDVHPFDLTQDGRLKLFWITKERGRGQELDFQQGKTVRQIVKEQVEGSPVLHDGKDPVGGFSVTIDGVELRRPIRFKFHQTNRNGLEHAVLFVGKFEPDLSKISKNQRGGDLSLESYLFWTGRVIPKENNGVLVRIRGASGALFDPTFFNYQVSEQTRLRQITSELFVQKGLDAALNIDRESFNFSHPHLQLVTKWFHGAIRQLTNRLKDEASRLRSERRAQEDETSHSKLVVEAEKVWRSRHGGEPIPSVRVVEGTQRALEAREEGSIALQREAIPTLLVTGSERGRRDVQASALAQILAAFGAFEDRTYEDQQSLITAIMNVFYGDRS